MDRGFNREKNGGRSAVLPRGVMITFCYVVPALLVVALIAAGFWGNTNRARAEELRRTNEGIYTQAYTELADSVYNMHIALSKLMVSEAPSTLSETLDDIRFESGTIAALMGRIPQSHVASYELNRFIIQIGDYAKQLSRALMRGGSLNETDRGQLMEAYTASEGIYNELALNLSTGNIPLCAMDGEGYFGERAQSGEENGESSADNEAQSRYPTLDYDGPYSDGTENLEPCGLIGEDVDETAALKHAREHLADEGAELEYGGVCGGRIPFHGFSGKLSDGRRAEIGLSVTGGSLMYLRTDGNDLTEGKSAGEGGSVVPNAEELSALKAAGKEWLASRGYPEMEATYARFYENCVLISFAAVEKQAFTLADLGLDALMLNSEDMSELINELRGLNGRDEEQSFRVIVYNDTVRLWLERGTGAVIGADAASYLFSHKERELPSEIISSEQAARQLSPNLEIERTALALIPLADRSERLCYEFTGSFAGADYVVYLDARTGDEVRILRLISDENGTSVL